MQNNTQGAQRKSKYYFHTDDALKNNNPEGVSAGNNQIGPDTFCPLTPNPDGEPKTRSTDRAEDVMEQIVDHAVEKGEVTNRVLWYGYGDAEDRWEPAVNFPASHLLTNIHRGPLEPDPVSLDAAHVS